MHSGTGSEKFTCDEKWRRWLGWVPVTRIGSTWEGTGRQLTASVMRCKYTKEQYIEGMQMTKFEAISVNTCCAQCGAPLVVDGLNTAYDDYQREVFFCQNNRCLTLWVQRHHLVSSTSLQTTAVDTFSHDPKQLELFLIAPIDESADMLLDPRS